MKNNNWTRELKEALKTSGELESFFATSFPDTPYPILLPLKLASRIKEMGVDSPLGKQFLPQFQENDHQGFKDPIGDERFHATAQLIHRYQNRVLFTPTAKCPVICRYCFRKNELGNETGLFDAEFERTLNYLTLHPEINELIFTGGDPFMLSNSKIIQFLESFSQIPHLKYIRFHTRTPVVLPSRITQTLISVLQRFETSFKKIMVVIHANHVDELGEESLQAIANLSHLRSPLLSQSVLLKGINDKVPELRELFDKLIDSDVTPYYLHHPDQVKGGLHFGMSLKEGREIYAQLRLYYSGWCLPQYVIDIPGGEGKVSAFNPESLQFSGTLINKQGKTVEIPHLLH